MFTTKQLQALEALNNKWNMWEQTRVSLFTQADKCVVDNARNSMGLQAANSSCHVCFIEDIKEVITAYRKQINT